MTNTVWIVEMTDPKSKEWKPLAGTMFLHKDDADTEQRAWESEGSGDKFRVVAYESKD